MTPSADRTPARGRRAEALARFEQVTEVPMLVMALLMVPLLVAPAVWQLNPAAAAADRQASKPE